MRGQHLRQLGHASMGPRLMSRGNSSRRKYRADAVLRAAIRVRSPGRMQNPIMAMGNRHKAALYGRLQFRERTRHPPAAPAHSRMHLSMNLCRRAETERHKS